MAAAMAPSNEADPYRQRRIEDLLGRVNSQVMVLSTNTSQQMSELERRLRDAEAMIGSANAVEFKLNEMERNTDETMVDLRREKDVRSSRENEIRSSFDELTRRLAEVEDSSRSRVMSLEKQTEQERAARVNVLNEIKTTIDQQQEAVKTLGEALAAERSNRLSLEEYTKREVADNAQGDDAREKKSDQGVR